MGQKSTILAVGLIIFAIILTILFMVSRVLGGGNEKPKETTSNENSVQEVEKVEEEMKLVPVSKIVETPNVYEGYDVAVESEIAKWTTNKSFVFVGESQSMFSSGAKGPLLVVTNEPFLLPEDPGGDRLGLGEGSRIIAYGKIAILNREQLEQVLGVSLDDPKVTEGNDILKNWDLGPVLLMSAYKKSEEK